MYTLFATCPALELWSNCEGDADEFSDVDLQLLVDDGAVALPAFLTVLGEVVTPEVEWTISSDPNHYWLMAIPDAMRPWLKVDIGLNPYRPGQQDDLGWTGETVWSQDPPLTPFDQVKPPEWPRPAPGTIDHFVLWNLIDLGRLAKFKFRGKPLNMLKFMSQLAQAVVTIEAVQLGQHNDLTDMPSTALISEFDQSASAHLADLNAPLVDHIYRLSQRLCEAIGDDVQLRSSCERMVEGSNGVLRSCGQSATA